MEQRPDGNQFAYSNDTLLSFDSFDFSTDLQQQPAFTLPHLEPAAVHLQHPTYSQHHTSLDGAVESSRWEAYGGFDVDLSRGNAYGSPVSGALQSAISQGGTIGDVLNHLPPASLQQSPPAGQHRRPSFDEEVCSASLAAEPTAEGTGASRTDFGLTAGHRRSITNRETFHLKASRAVGQPCRVSSGLFGDRQRPSLMISHRTSRFPSLLPVHSRITVQIP